MAESIDTWCTMIYYWDSSDMKGGIPLIGGFFSSIIWILSFILWKVLMVKAYQGTKYKLPWAGDLAEKWAG